MSPDSTASWPIPRRYDLFETTRALRLGGRDPTIRRESDAIWRVSNTPDGPATVRLSVSGSLHAEAWGPGAERAMIDLPHWIGLHEDPWRLPPHPVTDRLLRCHRGLRSTDTRDPFEALVSIVLQQKVTWVEAATTWRRLCESLGDPAPGPVDLRLPPAPRAIRRAGTATLLDFGIGLRRARTLMEVARVASHVRKAAALPTTEATAELLKIRGIGIWSAASLLGGRCGRPEPIPLGDYHLPNTIAWALASEARATDERMVELLKPFEGHAFQVIRLITAAGIRAPKRGPRRRIASVR